MVWVVGGGWWDPAHGPTACMGPAHRLITLALQKLPCHRPPTATHQPPSSALTIVLDMMGHVKSISPTMYDLDDIRYHFIALKPYPLDTSYMMGGIDIEETHKGPSYLWRWDDEAESGGEMKKFIELGGGVLGDQDCHDLNIAREEDAIWYSFDDSGFKKISITTGETLFNWTSSGLVKDPNHMQMIEDEEYAIISNISDTDIISTLAEATAAHHAGEVVAIINNEGGKKATANEEGAGEEIATIIGKGDKIGSTIKEGTGEETTDINEEGEDIAIILNDEGE